MEVSPRWGGGKLTWILRRLCWPWNLKGHHVNVFKSQSNGILHGRTRVQPWPALPCPVPDWFWFWFVCYPSVQARPDSSHKHKSIVNHSTEYAMLAAARCTLHIACGTLHVAASAERNLRCTFQFPGARIEQRRHRTPGRGSGTVRGRQSDWLWHATIQTQI